MSRLETETERPDGVADESGAAVSADPSSREQAGDPAQGDAGDQMAGGEPEQPADLDRVLRQFHLTGTVPDTFPVRPGLAGAEPSLIARYRSGGLRGPFPLVVDPEDGSFRSLTQLVDGLTEALDAGDSGERQKRTLLRLDRALRSGGEDSLETLIHQAVESVTAETPAGWTEDLDAATASFRAGLAGQRLVGYGDGLLKMLLARATRDAIESHAAPWIAEIDQLLERLSSLSSVDADEADHDADHLAHGAGGAFADAFNFGALGNLLDAVPHPLALPPDRRKRIDDAAQALTGLRRDLLDPSALNPLPSTQAVPVLASHAEKAALLERTLLLSRLETSDRYEPARHGSLIAGLSQDFLSDEDRTAVPPVLVWIDAEQATDGELATASGMLQGRAPAKVIVVMRATPDEPGSRGWSLVGQALHASDCHVVQASLSQVAALDEAVANALMHPGPALVAVYAPSDYLRAAGAHESRAVPFFEARPSSAEWAARVAVGANPSPEQDWVPAPDSESHFSWIDFAALAPAFGPLYMSLPASWETAALDTEACVPGTDPQSSGGGLPWIWVTTTAGERVRAVFAAPLMVMSQRALNRWRRLRELGGAANSYARVEREAAESEYRQRMEEELDALRTAHQAAMSASVDGLARQIVTNIAASMMGLTSSESFRPGVAEALAAGAGLDGASDRTGRGTGAGRDASGLPQAPGSQGVGTPDAVAGAETVGEPVVDGQNAVETPAEDEEDDLGLDEAYIETVRCTSCNECTDLNGMMFAYNENKQAFIKDPAAGPFRDMVMAAEKCPAAIIHPGKPLNPDEPHLDDLVERAKRFN